MKVHAFHLGRNTVEDPKNTLGVHYYQQLTLKEAFAAVLDAEIDIIIELDGVLHGSGLGITLCAEGIAPMQMAWNELSITSGTSKMTFLLADNTEPEGMIVCSMHALLFAQTICIGLFNPSMLFSVLIKLLIVAFYCKA